MDINIEETKLLLPVGDFDITTVFRNPPNKKTYMVISLAGVEGAEDNEDYRVPCLCLESGYVSMFVGDHRVLALRDATLTGAC